MKKIVRLIAAFIGLPLVFLYSVWVMGAVYRTSIRMLDFLIGPNVIDPFIPLAGSISVGIVTMALVLAVGIETLGLD